MKNGYNADMNESPSSTRSLKVFDIVVRPVQPLQGFGFLLTPRVARLAGNPGLRCMTPAVYPWSTAPSNSAGWRLQWAQA